MNKFLSGALSGCLATVPMTATMLWLHQRLEWREQYPLPPQQITRTVARRVGIKGLNATQTRAATWVSHFAFGAAAGALYGPLAPSVKAPPALKGAGFGVLVWAASYLGWLPATGILSQTQEQPARPNALMIVAHLVWGVVLGTLTASWQERD